MDNDLFGKLMELEFIKRAKLIEALAMIKKPKKGSHYKLPRPKGHGIP